MPATIGPIVGVTISTPDLDASADAYRSHLGYRVVDRGRVSAQHAALWGAPQAEGSPTLCMAPEAGDDFIFRFVERPVRGYRAFTAHGWNAVELIVADVDALAGRFESASPFEVVAPPLDLSFCTDIRAMQIRGPAGEIVYLTQFKREVPGLDAPPARAAVDRPFIVILGGASLAELQAYYATRFGVPETPAVESRVQTMALEFGLSREHRFRLAALPLAGRCYVEADEMPAGARPLPAAGGDLPAGVAIVSFAGAAGAEAAAVPPSDPVYGGASRACCLRGAAGELIEIVES